MPNITSRNLALQAKLRDEFAFFVTGGSWLVQPLALFIEQQIESYATQAKTRAHRGSPTSLAAASMDFTGQRQVVAEWLALVGAEGVTGTELAGFMEKERFTVLPRLTELGRMGYAVDSGRTRVNPRSGKQQIVWVHYEHAPKQEEV